MLSFTAREIELEVKGRLIGSPDAVSHGWITDSRKVEPKMLFFAIKGENFDANDYIESAFHSGASVIVGEKEAPVPEGAALIVVPDTVIAMQHLACRYRKKFQLPVIAVTGSVGKTTTKEMIYCAISGKRKTLKTEGNFNNEIGVPMTLFGLEEMHQAAIVEMGMNHFGEMHRLATTVLPTIAVINNIGVSHIENLGSQENIRKAKLEVLDGLDKNGTLVLNGDDPLLWELKGKLPVRTVYFGIKNEACDLRATEVDGTEFTVDGVRIHMPVLGIHNISNALCAILISHLLGISTQDAACGIEQYRSRGNRQNILQTEQGFLVMNDCYNASPQSVHAALDVLVKLEKSRTVAVLGDMLELGVFSEEAHLDVGKDVAEHGIQLLLTVGEAGKDIARGAKQAGMSETQVFSFDTNEQVSQKLSELLTSDDAVLIKGSHGMKMEQITNAIVR